MAEEKQSVMWLWFCVHHCLQRKQQAISTLAVMPDCLSLHDVYSWDTSNFNLTYSTPAVSVLKEKNHFLIVFLQVWSHTWQCRTLRVNCSILFLLCRKGNYMIINKRKVILEEVLVMWLPKSVGSAREKPAKRVFCLHSHQALTCFLSLQTCAKFT